VRNSDAENIDYRAMLAIAVLQERAFRLFGVRLKPASIVRVFGDTGLRAMLEEINGEPLA
jgi:hypothetical protein